MGTMRFGFLILLLFVSTLLMAPSKAAADYSISGTITSLTGVALSGVTVGIVGTENPAGSGSCTTTNTSGIFTCTWSNNRDVTLTPSLTGAVFTPTSLAVVGTTGSVTGQNFTAAVITVVGTVRSTSGSGVSGVTLAIAGAGADPSGAGTCNSTDINGRYSCTFSTNKGFALTPSKSGYTFSPTSITNSSGSAANLSGQDFTAAVTTTTTTSTTSTSTTTGTGATTTTTAYGGTGDTDIYIDNGSLAGSALPLVMFTLDYRSNLGSQVCNNNGGWGNCQSLVTLGYLTATDTADGSISMFEMMRAVLAKVMEPISGVRVGLMINHNHNTNCEGPTRSGCSNGGYVLKGFREFQVNDANGAKAALLQAMANLGEPGGAEAHTYQGAELFFEFFRYLTGQGIYNGHNGWKDFGDNTAATNLNVDFPLRSWDATVEDGANYESPIDDDDFNCAKIFTINFMFQVSSQENDSDTAILASAGAGGMALNVSQSNAFVDVIGWLHDNDVANGTYGPLDSLNGVQNVTSFFVTANDNISTRAYANAGGTTAPYVLSENPEELYDTLQSIFNQILSVSTTFVSASVPVNVFNRTQVMDSIYIAIFQADPDGKPLWSGNIKKLKLATDINGLTILVDATNTAAVAVDGRIMDTALTFWSNAAGADVVAADVSLGEVSGKDGRSVERGGAGQKIPGFVSGNVYTTNGTLGGRTLYTEPPTDASGAYTSTTLRDWDSFTLSNAADIQAALGVTTAAAAITLIDFSRGMDVSDFDGDASFTDLRPWLLGDPLHSRVMPVSYGAQSGFSATIPDLRLLMGSNDGYMHMFQDTDGTGTQLGVEKWGFIPLQVMGQISRLKGNAAGNPKHPHTVDGAAVVYSNDIDGDGTIESADGDTVYTYFGLRRGGRNYYALNITNPDAPAMLWAAKQGVGANFSEMGLTYSIPRVRKLTYAVGATTYTKQPVLVFAGGYDINKDTNILPGTNDTMGNAIYIVNAITGELIWKAVYGAITGADAVNPAIYYHSGLVNSMPSEVATLDSDVDGSVDRIYVGDTAGDAWRVDMKGTDRSKWIASKILTLGRNYSNTAANDRRFFHRPDVVRFKDETGYYDAVILGSGDREDPLDKNSATKVVNWIYMFKDRNINSLDSDSTPITTVDHSQLADLTDDCLQDSSCVTPPDLTYGWRIQMERSGEKVLSSPLTVSGVIFVSSYIPPGGVDAATCGPTEGSGTLYSLSLADATAPPKVDQVTGEIIPGDLTKSDRASDLASGGIPSDVVALPPDRILRPDLTVQTVSQRSFWKTYWYQTAE